MMDDFREITFIGIGTTCEKCGFNEVNKSVSADFVLTHFDCPKCGHKETLNLKNIKEEDK